MSVTLLPDDEYDRVLARNVRPADWVNPTPAGRYNLVVLGAGSAGLVTAAGAAGLGAKVALVERGLLGGDCLNVGCVPSKALLASAKAAAHARRAGEFGVRTGAVEADFPAVMARLRRLRAGLSPHDSAERFRSLGVDVYLGEGRFVGRDAVEVGGRRLEFSKAVIATGARPAVPDVPGLREAGFRTNEDVFALTELPARLAVMGGGPIGCELAQAFARLGSHVTLVHNGPGLLPKDDPAAAALVEAALRADGVDVRLGATPERVDAGRVLRLAGGGAIPADEILVAAGRVPTVTGLGLEAAGVEYDPREGVRVDDRLRTTNPRVYAAGDVCSRWKFTHAADALARLAIRNALFMGGGRVSALTVPWCTYTDPEVAQVGLTEEGAGRRGVAVDVFVQEMGRVDRAVLEGETAGFVKVVVRKGTGRIVGATAVGAGAGELIAVAALAMTHRLTLAKVAATVFPYPTRAEAVRKAADAWNRTRLTSRVKWLFERWLAWSR